MSPSPIKWISNADRTPLSMSPPYHHHHHQHHRCHHFTCIRYHVISIWCTHVFHLPTFLLLSDHCPITSEVIQEDMNKIERSLTTKKHFKLWILCMYLILVYYSLFDLHTFFSRSGCIDFWEPGRQYCFNCSYEFFMLPLFWNGIQPLAFRRINIE